MTLAVRTIALSGGVGGAKLALGLYHSVEPGALMVIANTGDDFNHLGLHISPDIDTLLYTLSDKNDKNRGWGRADETWSFMGALRELGGEDWFNLGDKDLALHVERTRQLRQGRTLSEVVDRLAAQFGLNARIAAMSDDEVRTIVETVDGPLEFQHYFVAKRCEPRVTGVRFDGAQGSTVSRSIVEALSQKSLQAIILCPSNPLISIDPILSVPGMRQRLQAAPAPIVAVSPIVGGKAIKGPAAKMMAELGMDGGAVSVARHYGDLLTGFVLDERDRALAPEIEKLGLAVVVTDTIMQSLADRIRLATEVLAFADRMKGA